MGGRGSADTSRTVAQPEAQNRLRPPAESPCRPLPAGGRCRSGWFRGCENPTFWSFLEEIGRSSAWEGPRGLKSGLSILIFSPESIGDDEKVGFVCRVRDDPDYLLWLFVFRVAPSFAPGESSPDKGPAGCKVFPRMARTFRGVQICRNVLSKSEGGKVSGRWQGLSAAGCSMRVAIFDDCFAWVALSCSLSVAAQW